MNEIITIMNKIKDVSIMGNKNYNTWSKSTEKNGYYKELKVEEIENGFLVCLNEHGEKDGKYTDGYRKYYSQTNPLDGLAPDITDDKTELEDTIKNFLDY